MSRTLILPALMTALALSFAPQAQAAFVTYVLDQTNGNPTLADGVSYAQLRIDDNTAGRLTFTITVLPTLSGLATSNFGLQQFGFNVLGTNPLQDASGSNAQWFLPTGWSANVAPPPNQLDGFGRFEVSVSTTGSNRLAPLQFQLIGTGLTLSSFNELSTGTAGEGNVRFAAHIAGFDAGGGLTSAYFGGSNLAPSPVPLPSVALFVPAWLAVAGVLARRRSRKTQA